MRIVHLTDTHLQVNGDASARFAQCLERIKSREQPDVIFQGGDIVMDALSLDGQAVAAQYGLAAKMLRDHVDVPIYHCLGNHDVWGWDRYDRAALAENPRFGKGWWKEWTGYDSTYYSFDRAGWHFIFLDSIGQTPFRGYEARLDLPQWHWLQANISQVPSTTPICLVTHIPILSAGAQFFGASEMSGKHWHIPGTLAHIDGRRLKDLIARHPNVKLCLSGHIHMSSRIHYAGVTHVCNGAVCGAWWNGDMQETKAGYGVVDLFSDGRHFSRYESY
ncbi:Ser/Thr protein phosphatase family protein [Fimbriimonas ginsengisoli Gsoil 348]|uniref:Ser/Thr protein phosphatase family protein n=1 Tax=Fimbriimonas ginsengisoli Gsoil 348 TaxID=661478 RepID=A0A068NLC2_FIMGI|nr:Ser/Thr protein phosphatase family protein [Fimbriimonas ginsengisoli Gsoil 348]